MIRRPLPFALLFAAACGSGHLVPDDSPQPAAAPPSEPTAAAPAPAAQPTTAPAPQAPPAQPPSNASAYVPYDAGSLPIRRIGQWSTSGIATPERLVIRDDSSYARFWSGLGAGSRPSVDFTQDVVIVAAAGQQPTGGHGIQVSRVVRAGQGLAVEVVETAPGPGCPAPQALTQPVDVVVVPVGDAKTWSFSERTVAQACR